jgi:Response regulator containing CheY-like receiver domain and AraC-type DNA-binding domain
MPLSLDKLSVLVVDDMAEMRDLLTSVLKILTVRDIRVAKDGIDGYQKAQQFMPDLIITDWIMQPMDGIEMAMKMRRDPGFFNATIPIIMMTGYSALDRVALARDIGVTEFLVKPFKAADLARRIEVVINQPRDFVRAQSFVGPDRRRRQHAAIAKERRLGKEKREGF